MTSRPTPFAERVEMFRARTEIQLDRCLPRDDAATSRLTSAMRYSVLGGGKRLRPILVYATGQALSAPLEHLDAPAAAVELIHAYSLIHDDLPAMDDDDLRRGRPTCHRAYDEGTAMLAGDALQALAFGVLAKAPQDIPADARVAMLAVLADSTGTLGMAGGQAIDLAGVGRTLDEADIECMHRRKTGALIQASVELGAIAAGAASGVRRAALARFGAEIGLAFQIQDDILDVTGETEALGKQVGADSARAKPTYPSILGLPEARRRALLHRDQAIEALEGLGAAAGLLRELASFVVDRAH